ncbi:MAG TPA: NAD(P)H-quinone oxidoreductase [Polyangia bacterium]|jgi:putative PIG3 family NAD(P)H quinone oxidoreductase|nr:NAD(P)H-quinone oxidoreductase [Polyangia bacterium]
MRTIYFNGFGGPEVIEVRDVPAPAPARGEVLVKVRGAGLNRADLLQRMGAYPPPPGYRVEMPGLELAGEVVALGEGVSEWRVGDRVMSITSGEAQAELAVLHERMLVRIPEGMSYEEAGGVPEAFVTAHDALFTIGGLRPGWTVLVHAVGSGVATAAVQLARTAGATVIGTSRSADKLERARELGLDHGVLVERGGPRFADRVKELTGGQGAQLILDFVGASYVAENLTALASCGTLVGIGLMGGLMGTLDLGLLLRRRLRIEGTVLRSRPFEEKIRAMQAFRAEVLPLLAARRVRPVLEAIYPLAEARTAYERMERNENFGKFVITP